MNKIKVYIAAGWFSEYQDKALTYLEDLLFNNDKFEVFSPRKEIILNKDATVEEQNKVFDQNCQKIIEADLVIASTVDKDMGTIWETGFAYNKTPVVYTLFDDRIQNPSFNIMLGASGLAAFIDKTEFEKYIDNLTKHNLLSSVQRWRGDCE